MTLWVSRSDMAIAYSATTVFPADVWAETNTDCMFSMQRSDSFWNGSNTNGYSWRTDQNWQTTPTFINLLLSVCLYLFIYFFLSFFLSLFIYLFIYLLVCLIIYFIYLSIYLCNNCLASEPASLRFPLGAMLIYVYIYIYIYMHAHTYCSPRCAYIYMHALLTNAYRA